MRWAIVGMGLIGKKRATALGSRCVATCDVEQSFYNVIARDDVDAVVVATPHHLLAGIAHRAVYHDKHVLIEKPGAVDPEQLRAVHHFALERNVRVQVGYNLRFHPAIAQAKKLVDAGAIGPLMYVHGFYGHGARVGYDREWRMQKAKAGGGSLLDQGSHLIDLSRWFLGPLVPVAGHTSRSFWTAAEVEDNAFVSLRTAAGQTAWLRASCSEWKNRFLFEVYGTTGKLVVDGIGASYGPERLLHYQMRPEMGPPVLQAYLADGTDRSWQDEIAAFEKATVEESRACMEEAISTLETIERLYAHEPTR